MLTLYRMAFSSARKPYRIAVADPEGPGGRPPLFLDQTEARRAEKNVFEIPPPPPYLRVWIPHWIGLPFTHFGAIAVTKQSYVTPISKKESPVSYDILNYANRILQC